MPKEYDPAEVERQAFATGWEREHGGDYGEYPDSLLDPDDPFHDIAVAGEKEERAKRELAPAGTPGGMIDIPGHDVGR